MQEGLLGTDHQKAYDVIADAGEVFYLGIDGVTAVTRSKPFWSGSYYGMS